MVILNAKEEKVHGEIYRIREPKYAFDRLDEYEECSETHAEPHEYKRVKVSVFVMDGTELEAWVYEYNQPLKMKKTPHG